MSNFSSTLVQYIVSIDVVDTQIIFLCMIRDFHKSILQTSYLDMYQMHHFAVTKNFSMSEYSNLCILADHRFTIHLHLLLQVAPCNSDLVQESVVISESFVHQGIHNITSVISHISMKCTSIYAMPCVLFMLLINVLLLVQQFRLAKIYY